MLGLLWLLDGALQFQPYMYSRGFIHTLTLNTTGQPDWLAASIRWGAHIAQHNLMAANTLFAVAQVLLGLGLLCRRTVKVALGASFAWAVIVWWFGEAFGMLLAGTASPLTGAPGAVVLYALVGLLVWPGPRPTGLLEPRGAKVMWAALWLAMGWTWLLGANSDANAVSDAVNAAPSGTGWLTSFQHSAASIAKGNGLVIAVTLAGVSWAIGFGVLAGRRPTRFLLLAIALNAAYWVIGQGLGGIVTGSATDPNAAPLFILLSGALYPLAARADSTRATVWTRQVARLDTLLSRRRAASAPAAATAVAVTAAAPLALWAVLQMPFSRVPAFASATLSAAQAMPTAHKWLIALIVVQLVWAAACAVHVVRGRNSLDFLCALAVVLTVVVAVCTGILAAHLIAPERIGRYNGMPVGIKNQPAVWVALVSFLAVGVGQLATGAYAVSGRRPQSHPPTR